MSTTMVTEIAKLPTSRMSAKQMRATLLGICGFYAVTDAQLTAYVLASGNGAAIKTLSRLLSENG